jgi:hypothetical protein
MLCGWLIAPLEHPIGSRHLVGSGSALSRKHVPQRTCGRSDWRSPSGLRTRPAAALHRRPETKPRPWFRDKVCNVANMRAMGTHPVASLDQSNRLAFEAGRQQKYVMLSHCTRDLGPAE